MSIDEPVRVVICCRDMEEALRWEGRDPDPPKFLAGFMIWFCVKRHHYGIPIFGPGGSTIRINFCPWCGANLARISSEKLE